MGEELKLLKVFIIFQKFLLNKIFFLENCRRFTSSTATIKKWNSSKG